MKISNPSDLLREFVRHMRELPELMEMLAGDTANIVLYEEPANGDLVQTVYNTNPPKLVVYVESVAGAGYPALIRVRIGIAIRAKDPFAIYTAMMNGVSLASGADGLPFYTSQVLRPFGAMAIPELERRFIPVNDGRVFDYWEIRTSYADKGA